MALFRDHLLKDRRVAVGAGAVAGELVSQLRSLGADVTEIPAGVMLDEDAAGVWVDAGSPIHALVHDAGPAFRTHGLQPALEQAWIATRAIATGALIPSGAGGKLILICPRLEAGLHADAARAALENLARTLSVEWARHSITTVAVAPGTTTSARELATFVSFVLSRGGDYLSGCRLDMGVLAAGSPPE